jgi:hypothetical protein
MLEHIEYARIKARVDELMSGGIFGDGIGPGNTSRTINDEFGTSYSPEEVWRIWRQKKEWANPKDDTYPI